MNGQRTKMSCWDRVITSVETGRRANRLFYCDLEAFEKGRYVPIEIGMSTFYHSDIRTPRTSCGKSVEGVPVPITDSIVNH